MSSGRQSTPDLSSPVGERREHGHHPGVYWNEGRQRWEKRVTIDGKRHLFSAKTAKEVADKVKVAEGRADAGLIPVAARTTVARYLEWWTDDALPHADIAASTLSNYRYVVRLYIVPHIGHVKLNDLSSGHVTRMLADLEQQGIAPNTRRAARSVLRRALRRAEQDGLVIRNVARIADGVRVPAREGRTLTPEQARIFLDHVAGHRLYAAWAVMLALGLRRGETLGLSWPDLALDEDPARLTVNRSLKRLPDGLHIDQPKTRLSRRTLYLPAPVAGALRSHRTRQLAERLHAGPEWTALPFGVDLVFRTPFGTAVDPDNFKNLTYKQTAAAGVELDEDGEPIEGTGIGRWGPHEMRHSAASILLAMGVPLKVVSETLGHSSIRITSDVYGHLLEPARQEAADAAERALWGGVAP